MPTGIDHVVILVDNLDRAVEQYSALGFTVTPGGKHARFTHNALITFQDGSYLELIAFYEQPDESSGESHRWFQKTRVGGGIIDYALAAPNLDAVIADADARGITTGGVAPGSRTRPDGQQLEWRSAIIQGDNPGALPFMIEDVTDRGLRVPAEAADHANGVRGIRSLVIGVSDLATATQRYNSLLDREAPSGEGLPNIDGADGVYYLVGPHRIDLAAPTGGNLQDYVAARGDSPYELSLLAPETKDLDPSVAGGARIRLIAG
jgi:catechol 2,3-dioxygenase-like lactoylglutathione lyase family enzyme